MQAARKRASRHECAAGGEYARVLVLGNEAGCLRRALVQRTLIAPVETRISARHESVEHPKKDSVLRPARADRKRPCPRRHAQPGLMNEECTQSTATVRGEQD